MDYAIIRLGGKQYRVRAGETLVVDRVRADEGASITPEVLLGDAGVTATVVAHERGPKIRIGKYKRRTGYRRHNGFRAAVTRIRIDSVGGAKASARAKAAPKAAAPAEEAPATEAAAVETVEAPAGLPEGYAGMTVAQVSEAAKGWSHDGLEAALAYERAHANRKGALSALESALAKEGQA